MKNGVFLYSTRQLWPNVLSLLMVQKTSKSNVRKERRLKTGCSLLWWEGKALRAALAFVAGARGSWAPPTQCQLGKREGDVKAGAFSFHLYLKVSLGPHMCFTLHFPLVSLPASFLNVGRLCHLHLSLMCAQTTQFYTVEQVQIHSAVHRSLTQWHFPL